MSRDRDAERSRDEPEGPARAGAGQLVGTVVLLVTVIAILGAGAVLRSDSPGPASSAEQAPRPSVLSRESAPPAPRAADAVDGPLSTTDAMIGRPSAPLSEPLPAPRVAPPAPPARPTPSPEPAGDDLQRRSAADVRRLTRHSGEFTAQIAVACSPDNLRGLLRRSAGADRFFLVAAPELGASCYRVCWGTYATAKEASSAADLPASVRGRGGRPLPKAISEILR